MRLQVRFLLAPQEIIQAVTRQLIFRKQLKAGDTALPASKAAKLS